MAGRTVSWKNWLVPLQERTAQLRTILLGLASHYISKPNFISPKKRQSPMKSSPEGIINNIILRTSCVRVWRTRSQVQGSSPTRKVKFQVFLMLQSCFFALLLYTFFFPSLSHLHINIFWIFLSFTLKYKWTKGIIWIFCTCKRKIVQTNTLSQSVFISILFKNPPFFHMISFLGALNLSL
jgi:hypothetical protein